MKIESPDEEDFTGFFLTVISDHAMPRLIATITNEGNSLDLFSVSWSAGLAEEAGEYPLISSPAFELPYFIFYARSTGLTGYMCFKPINH